MLKDFKQFLLRGPVVDVACGVVMANAFLALVKAIVENLLTPLISAVVGHQDFANLAFSVRGSHFLYGLVVNAVIAFALIAACVFFLVILPVNALRSRRRTEPPIDPTTRDCPECLSSIPKEARRCAFCTAEVGIAA
jgi:large conductance mechanosensitive channel